LGKTHLLHAIANGYPAKGFTSVAYLNCRDLLGRGSPLPPAPSRNFWQFIDQTQILLIDDVHMLPAQRDSQHYLLELFNGCYNTDRQLVCTTNRLPHQIPELSAGLRSRLGWGLIARISEPDLHGCQQLVETILDGPEKQLSADICRLLSEQGPLGFQQIKDCVEKLQVIVKNEGRFPNLKERPLFFHGEGSPTAKTLSITAIQKEVCATYNISLEALPKASKSRPLVIARQVGMYLTRKLTGSTYTAIGTAFGGRDHSTVIYACRKVRGEMKRNPSFAERIVDIEKKLLKAYKEKSI
jgi:chromosomal replication initiator protein